MGQITFKTGTITFKGGTITFKNTFGSTYVIISGTISAGNITLGSQTSYEIKLGGATLLSGSRAVNEGNLTLSAGNLTTLNNAMGTGGGTFDVVCVTEADQSFVTLTLNYSTNGSGSTQVQGTGTFWLGEGQQNGQVTIPS